MKVAVSGLLFKAILFYYHVPPGVAKLDNARFCASKRIALSRIGCLLVNTVLANGKPEFISHFKEKNYLWELNQYWHS